MRKMKKINGFLVVRFNDREKRNYPTLGSFGVIDAEDYTGDLDYDLDAMEYTDADLIEIAVEQARGLNAEKDFSEEPTTYTVVAETADEAREEEVAPKAMALSWAEQLKTQIKSKHYPDIDPRTAAHELNGYKAALRDLGLLDAEEAFVEPDVFGEACALYDDEGHHVDMMLPTRAGLALMSPHDYEEGETFTGCTVQTLKCRRCGRESFAWSKGPALGPEQEPKAHYHLGKPGPSPVQEEAPEREGSKPRTGFDSLPENIGYSLQTKRIYALGLVLAEGEECPPNDCRVYLNIFNMARSLDDAIDAMDDPDSYPAIVLRRDLHARLRELGEMYFENYAIKKFREGMQP